MANVNNMDFKQIATVLNEVRQQATGMKSIAPVNEAEFVSVGQTVLKMGYDPVLGAITQVLSRTIFSNRPYQRQFGSIRKTPEEWGAITRKLAVVDKDFENDVTFELIDGEAVDMFKVNKPIILQLNFYGQTVWQKSLTIFRNQLKSAFDGSRQFGEFMSMCMQNITDMMTQAEETLARLTISNYALGKIASAGAMSEDPDEEELKAQANKGIVHLLSEYNMETGANLDKTTVKAPENFGNFVKWAYARMATISKMMTQRTGLYQIQVDGKPVMRHTPMALQKTLIYSPLLNEINARVKSDTYHNNFLEQSDVEEVAFWQAAADPTKMSGTPAYLTSEGTIETAAETETADIVGMIFDTEALGYSVTDEFSSTTPYNAAGNYWNQFWHNTKRWFNDFTEKGVVFLLD